MRWILEVVTNIYPPLGVVPEVIKRTLQVSAAGSLPMTDEEVVAILATIHSTDVLSVNLIALRSGPWWREKEDGIHASATDEGGECLTNPENVSLGHIEVQPMIESALQLFEERASDSQWEGTVEAKAVSVFETANQEIGKGEKTDVFRAMENVVRRVLSQGAANKVIITKVNHLFGSQHFIQHSKENIIKNPSFIVPITYLEKHHAPVAVTERAKIYVQRAAQTKQEDQATLLTPQTWMLSDSSQTLFEEDKTNPKKMKSP